MASGTVRRMAKRRPAEAWDDRKVLRGAYWRLRIQMWRNWQDAQRSV